MNDPTLRPGRNQLCRCGSGRKYKRCCFPADQAARAATAPPPKRAQTQPGVTTQLPHMGLPGDQVHLTVGPVGADGREFGTPRGAPGRYSVSFVLWRPGHSLAPNEVKMPEHLQGDSFLQLRKDSAGGFGTLKFNGTTEGGTEYEIIGYPNAAGFLGKLTVDEIVANDFDTAETLVYDAIIPGINHMSVMFDTPLDIYEAGLMEKATGVQKVIFRNPPREITLNATPPGAHITAEFRAFASIYRIAIASNSSLFQFLCYYKIIEGIADLRQSEAMRAREEGKEVVRYIETIPVKPEEMSAWLGRAFPQHYAIDATQLDHSVPAEFRGKRIGAVRKDILEPLRNSVAHLFSKDGGLIHGDFERLSRQREIDRALFMAKAIARVMLTNQFPSLFAR
jgi:hypothetical protein